jgi:hypothetical protein
VPYCNTLPVLRVVPLLRLVLLLVLLPLLLQPCWWHAPPASASSSSLWLLVLLWSVLLVQPLLLPVLPPACVRLLLRLSVLLRVCRLLPLPPHVRVVSAQAVHASAWVVPP